MLVGGVHSYSALYRMCSAKGRYTHQSLLYFLLHSSLFLAFLFIMSYDLFSNKSDNNPILDLPLPFQGVPEHVIPRLMCPIYFLSPSPDCFSEAPLFIHSIQHYFVHDLVHRTWINSTGNLGSTPRSLYSLYTWNIICNTLINSCWSQKHVFYHNHHQRTVRNYLKMWVTWARNQAVINQTPSLIDIIVAGKMRGNRVRYHKKYCMGEEKTNFHFCINCL